MPMSIPPFSNVPIPGDGITSAWAQQLTQFAVDSPRGVVARREFAVSDIQPAASTETAIPLVSPFSFTFETGRRYRIGLLIRAWRGTPQTSITIKADGLAWGQGLWVSGTGGWFGLDQHLLVNGDGVTRALTLTMTANATGVTLGQSLGGNWFYIEDVGAAVAP